jgi:hypothetical protein
LLFLSWNLARKHTYWLIMYSVCIEGVHYILRTLYASMVLFLGSGNSKLHVPRASYRHSLWIQVRHMVSW